MRRIYLFTAALARRVFRATGMRVPRSVRRLNGYLRRRVGEPQRAASTVSQPRRAEPAGRDISDELDALNRRIERLETQSYLDGIGRRQD